MIEDYKDRPNDLNLNCADPLGRTSLVIVIAIENETSYELLEVLLEGGIKVSDGLLHAISEDYVEAVELLLEWEEKNHKDGTPCVRLDIYSTHQTIRYTPLFSMHSYGTTCPRKNAITLEPLGLVFFPFGPE